MWARIFATIPAANTVSVFWLACILYPKTCLRVENATSARCLVPCWRVRSVTKEIPSLTFEKPLGNRNLFVGDYREVADDLLGAHPGHGRAWPPILKAFSWRGAG